MLAMGMHIGAVGGAWYKSNGILNSMDIEEECFISLKLYISKVTMFKSVSFRASFFNIGSTFDCDKLYIVFYIDI